MAERTTTRQTTRMARRIRDVTLVLLITVIMFVAFEKTVGVVWSQVSTLKSADALPISVQDSLLIHRYRPNNRIIHSGPEFDVEYEINANGFRGATTHGIPKPSTTTRILLLGDSFTFGQGVVYDSIWPTLLERNLQLRGYDVDIVNAGVQGYSTREEVLLLQQLHAMVDPDIVILALLPNDLYANAPIQTTANTAAVAKNTGGRSRLRSGLQSILLLQRTLASIDRLYVRLYLLTPWTEYYRVPPSPTFSASVEATTQLLREAHTFSQTNGSTLLLLSVPQQFQVLAEATGYESSEIDVHLVDRTIGEFARAEGIPWIPMIDTFTREYRVNGKDLFYRVDGHLNAVGNRILADKLTQQLRDRLESHPHPRRAYSNR